MHRANTAGFLFAFLALLMVYHARAQCDSLFLGEDVFLCPGATLELDAGDGYLSYLWSTGSIQQTITVSEPGDYWCTVQAVDSVNLIVNGEFTGGNTGFGSDYTHNPVSLYGEGTYAVVTNPTSVHPDFSSCTDHTTGTGPMMVVNGAPVPEVYVWYQEVAVEPNSDYHYSGWFTSVHPVSPAILDLSINGVAIEQVSLSGATCLWENFYEVWNSGTSTSAYLRIVNQNTSYNGNDFAIDDISLYGVCTATDTVAVILAPEPVVDLGADTALCDGDPLVLFAGGPYVAYLWQDGSANPTCEVTAAGAYWVIVTNEYGCIGGDTIQVNMFPAPEPMLGSDTLLCEGDELLLAPGPFTTYTWQDNTTDPSFTVTAPGTYWVTVTNEYGCAASDTIVVATAPYPSANLGNDTTLCAGEEYVLSPGSGFLSYLWQDGSTGAAFAVNQSGWYWVTITNACGADADTVQVTFQPAPEVDLGPDTVICAGQSLTLQPEGNFFSYTWQDGSEFPFHVVEASGFYSVEVTNAFGCTGTDEVYVEVSGPQLQLGSDTLLCDGEVLQLDAGEDFKTYLWQDGSTGRFFTVTQAGEYSVTATNAYGCEASGTVNVEAAAAPVIELGGDRSLCEGDSLVLQAPAGPHNTYFWNGVEGTDQLTVHQGGTYSLAVTNPCGSATGAVDVQVVVPPAIDLGPDRVLDPGQTITLDAGEGFDTYAWQDGSGNRYFDVTEAGWDPADPWYAVEGLLATCKATDSVKVEYFLAWVPNVITPNGDGKNDVFRADPERWGAVRSHKMTVYNRWGERVWESEDFTTGWDGKQNGRKVSDGTYFWVLEASYGDEAVKRIYKGTLSVIGGAGR